MIHFTFGHQAVFDIKMLISNHVYIYIYIYICKVNLFISVAGGGGGGAGGGSCRGATAPIMLFRSFVGTFGNLSVQVSRQACHLYRQSILMYRQNIEINSSLVFSVSVSVCRYNVVYI